MGDNFTKQFKKFCMEFLQIISCFLLASSLFLITYVSFNNYHATRKLDKNQLKRIDLMESQK